MPFISLKVFSHPLLALKLCFSNFNANFSAFALINR